MKARVGGGIEIDFGAAPVNMDKTSFLYWVTEKLPFAKAHAARQHFVFSALSAHLEGTEGIRSVKEFFGGAGLGTSVVLDIFTPESYSVYELDQDCIDHLRRQPWPDCVTIKQGDARQTMMEAGTADLMFMDYHLMNPVRLSDWQHQIDRVFKLRPKAVYLNDTSFWSMQLHRKRFGEALGAPPLQSREEYIEAYSRYMLHRYNYSALAVSIHQGASFLYVPGPVPSTLVEHISVADGEKLMQTWN